MIVNWFKERRHKQDEKRKADAHAAFVASFNAENAKLDSIVHKTVLTTAHAMARGMMMRWLDDRGTHRCRLCLSTDQLHRRVVESKNVQSGRGRLVKQERVIYLCDEHRNVAIPGLVENTKDADRKDRDSLRDALKGAAPAGVDRGFLQSHMEAAR